MRCPGAALAVLLAAAVPAAAGEVVDLEVSGRSLAIGGAPATPRFVRVVLPDGYEKSPGRRYPVLMLLHSFASGPGDWLGGEGGYEGLHVGAVLDRLQAEGAASGMIVVLPDGGTDLGGSWYCSSPVTGDWETFLAVDVPRAVDGALRTIADRAHRGLAGQSMGAYGALRLAILRPDVFGAVLAMSPLLVEDANPLGEMGARLALIADREHLEAAPVPAKVLWSRARAFSPEPESPPAYARLPYRIERDEVVRDDDVWARWTAQTLRPLLRAHPSALARTVVRIEVGNADPLAGEARQLGAELDSLGVAHELVEFRGGHVQGVRRQFETSVFAFFAKAFADVGR